MFLLKFFYKLYLIVKFIFLIIYDAIIANFQVAYDVITPNVYAKPGIISIPLDLQNEIAITVFANVISFTPGTLTLDISKDRKTLYMHGMYIKNKELLKEQIKKRYEKRIMEIFK